MAKPSLAIALFAKKHPDKKMDDSPGDMPPAGDPDMPDAAPPSDEALACCQDLMHAVKMGDAMGVWHALQDVFQEMEKQPHEEAGEPTEATEAEAPPAEE